MPEDNNKNLDKKVEQLEEATKKYASKDTVISIGGYEFTPAKLMIAFTIVSGVVGTMYSGFEIWKDYQGMKKRINEYVAPDLSELNKKMEITMQNSEKSVQYTQDIKNDLKQDIRRLESVVEGVERGVKQNQRETDLAVKEAQTEVRQTLKQVQGEQNSMRRDLDSAIKETNANVDRKIQRALDNPLANR